MGRFTKGVLVTFANRILQLVLGLLASIIIARVLGPGGKGIYSLAILLPTFLIVFTQLGIGRSSVYYLGKKKYLPKEIFGSNIVFSLLLSILAILAGLIIVFLWGEKLFPGVQTQYLLLGLPLIPFQVFFIFVVWILLGLQEIEKYNFINSIRVFVFLSLILFFLLGLRLGTEAAIVSLWLSFFIGCVILFFQTKKETGGLVFSFNKGLFKDFFDYGYKVHLGNIATFLHLRIDTWMINIFLNPAMVGFYSVGVEIAERIWLISQSAGVTIFPRISSEKDKERLKKFTPLVNRNILFLTLVGAILFFFLSRWIIVFLYSEKFLKSVLPFQILLVGMVAISGGRVISNDLAGRGKPMINTYIAIVSVILNILLNLILIPKLGIVGAAWATSVSYTFTFILKIIAYSKISGNPIREVIFIKKSDFRFYKDLLSKIR